MNFAKFLRTPFFTEHLRWLLLFLFVNKLFTAHQIKKIQTQYFQGLLFIFKRSFIYCYVICMTQKQPPKVFYEKRVPENFAKFTGKNMCQSPFFNKVLIKRLWHRCFPVNFAKLSRTPFFQNISGRLLLMTVP